MGIKSIAVVGAGGVGGYFGGKLCNLLKDGNNLRVSFIARGAHLRAIQEGGLQLSSESDGEIVCRPSLATDDFDDLPPADLYLICVKEFDLPAILTCLAPSIDDKTILLPLLNGMDVYARVRSVIKNGIVLPACVYVGTHIESPGRVVQKGGACKILFGPDPLRPEFAADDLLSLFARANIKSEWTVDIQAEIWQKFIFICAYGLVTAAHDKTVGEVYADEALRSDVQRIMNEAASLAEASGIRLPADVVEASLRRAGGFPFEAKTSFQRDFEPPDKPDERDLFAGAMVRRARELGIEVPKTGGVSCLLNERKPLVRVST